MSLDSVKTLTKDLKDILLKTKQELKNKDDYIKKQNTIHDLTKKEYQKLYDEYSDLKKKMNQYESYVRMQRIERKKKNKTTLKNKKRFENLSKKMT